MTLRFALTGLAFVLFLAGCEQEGPPEDQPTGSFDRETVIQTRAELDSAVVAALDSGNAAYRIGNYERALEHYRSAVDAEEDLAAGWFGIYMAELALGNDAAADSAMERARASAPGASMIHPAPDSQ